MGALTPGTLTSPLLRALLSPCPELAQCVCGHQPGILDTEVLWRRQLITEQVRGV